MNKYDQARKILIDEILEMSEEYTRNDLEKMGFLFLEALHRGVESKSKNMGRGLKME